jgi:zinc transport system ATP-binding protein
MNNILLQLKSVTAGYEKKPVVKEANLTVYERDFLGIIGPNGGGKTTLVRTILGLIPPLSGEIVFYKEGRLVPSLSIGYLPQISRIDVKFPVTAKEMILSGLAHQRNRMRRYNKEHLFLLEKAAEQVGISYAVNRPICELSGGEMQRVLLGRAIISDPELLILDEPGTYIDKLFETQFYRILEELNRKSAIILISHDINAIASQVKNIACVNRSLHYHAANSPHAFVVPATYASTGEYFPEQP